MDKYNDELLAKAINTIAEKVSQGLLQEFIKLPKELQLNVVIIKAAQLILANILCHVVSDIEELYQMMETQGQEIKDLTMDCSFTGFAHKFNIKKH